MSVDQEILDGVGASAASYTDISTGTSSLSGYTVVGTPYTDEYSGGPNLGLQMVVYASADHSNVIVTFVGTNEGKDAIGDLDLAWNQFNDSTNQTNINSAIASALAANPGAEVTFAGHSAGGIIAQYAAYTYQNQATANDQDVTVNLVTNNAPGATDVLATQSGVDPSAVVDTASNFGYVANTYEQNDIVHLMGSAYVGSTTDGAQTLAIVTPDVYDPVSAHLKATSLSDLGLVDDGTAGYSLTADTPQNFGISDAAAALTSAALAHDADAIPLLDGPSAYAYATGQFLSIAGTLGAAGQSDGVKAFLDAYLNGTVNHIAAEPGGTSWLADADAGAQAFAVEKLESWATNSPDTLTAFGETIKDEAMAGAYTAADASAVGSALVSASEGAYEDVIAAFNGIIGDNPVIATALPQFGNAETEASPLVIDLSSGHTGITLTTFNAATTSTFFDIEGTGLASQTAWTSGDTGFLVRDLNSNGKIDSVNEMFGSTTVDGFAKLAALDSNGDLKIDSNDSAWSSLQIWLDSNGNGITDSGELHSLSSLGISSIDLAGVAASTSTIDGNSISHTSTVTFSNGSTSAIDDVWFQHSTVDTFYNSTYTLDDDTLFMPDLRGSGLLPELAISMSQDSTLESLVSDFASGFSLASFAGPSTLDSDIANILYRWAGVDGVATDARGPNVNAQDLEFLEHLFDQNYNQYGSSEPLTFGGKIIETAWQEVLDGFKADMLIQTGAGSLFDGLVSYNPVTGAIEGDTHLSQTGIENLTTYAPGTDAAAQAFWVGIADFIDNTEGITNLTTDEQTWLDTAVTSTTTASWDDIVSSYDHSNPGLSIDGTSGNNSLTGGNGDDVIYGNGGTDLIHGGAGDDTITDGSGSASTIYGDDGDDLIWGSTAAETFYGGNGNDVIHGGGGNDTFYGGTGGNFLYGGSGNDTFVFGGGDDVITTNSGTDQIILPSGITSGDLTFTRTSTGGSTSQFNDLLITFAGGGSIEIVGHFLGSGYQVGTIVFNDSSTLNLTAITGYNTILTSASDNYSPGLNTNQVIFGMDGNDNITTGTGNDTLDGGNGNDLLQGGTGNDTYLASPGFDKISDTGGTDAIVIPTGYSIDDVTFSRHIGTYGPDNDLIVDIRGLGEIQVENQFYSSTYAVENLYFVDGASTVSLASQTIQTIGTSGNDTLYGITSGVAGNWFDGRGGSDTIVNGVGNNTYIFAAGFGVDTISSVYHAGTNILQFTGVDPDNILMWTTSNGSLHIEDVTNPSDSITVSAAVTGSGTAETSIASYLQEIQFSDSTTWHLSDGLTLTAPSGGGSLYGSPYNDTLIGGAGGDYLYGNGGNNTLISGGGNDNMYGGSGNNTFEFSSGFSTSYITTVANAGTNTLHLAGINPNNIIMWTDTNGYLHVQDTTHSSQIIEVYAGTTGSGIDESTIGQHLQEITFDSSYSTTWNLTAGLTLTAANSGGTLLGTGHGDMLDGGTGGDTIYANAGNNTINGGGGYDSINLGTGADTILFKGATAETGIDTINSFSTAKGDKLDIADVISSYDPLADAIANFVQVAVVSGNTQIKVDTDGSGTSYTQIATLTGFTGHTLSDLITDGNLIVHHT